MTTLCAIYARVSDEYLQTGEDKVSIATQLDDCRAHAATLGAVVVSEYVDDKRYRVGGAMVDPAGWRADRPAWCALLAAAERGEFGLVIAWHSTRLFRGYKPMADLLDVAERRRLRVVCVKDQFNTDLAPIYAWAAKQERQAFAARSAMGKVGRAKRGLPTTRAPAYYRKVIDAAGKTTGYELIPEARPWLAEIARLYLDGHGLNYIAQRLRVNPISGARLSPQRVRDVLAHPFNYGVVAAYRYAQGGPVGEYAGTHEPCWPPDVCAALQAERARRATPNRSHNRGAGLFSGVLRCGVCGRVMSATQTGRKPNQQRQYVCWHSATYKTHPRNSILESKLIRLLQDLTDGVTDDDLAEALAGFAFAPGMSAETRAALESQRAVLSGQIVDLENDLAAVKSPAARQAVAGQISELQAALGDVAAQIDQAQRGGAAPDPAAILANARRLRAGDVWQLPAAELRPIIVRTFQALHVHGGKLAPAPKGD